MGMSIDKAISWLLSITEHEGEDIPIYDTDVEPIKMAIETMRKYQKIKEIINWRNRDSIENAKYHTNDMMISDIRKVLNGNVD